MGKHRDFSGIKNGEKINHLTLIERFDRTFGVFQCDCGKKIRERISQVFGYGSPKTCGTCELADKIRKASGNIAGNMARKKATQEAMAPVAPASLPNFDVVLGNKVTIGDRRGQLVLVSTDLDIGTNGKPRPTGTFRCDCGLEASFPLWRFYSRLHTQYVRNCQAATCPFYHRQIGSPIVSGENAGPPVVIPSSLTNIQKVESLLGKGFTPGAISQELKIKLIRVKTLIKTIEKRAAAERQQESFPQVAPKRPVVTKRYNYKPLATVVSSREADAPKTGFTPPSEVAQPQSAAFMNPPEIVSVMPTQVIDVKKLQSQMKAFADAHPTSNETLPASDTPLPPVMSPQAAIAAQLAKLRGAKPAPLPPAQGGMQVVTASFLGWTLEASCPVTIGQNGDQITISYQDLRIDLVRLPQ